LAGQPGAAASITVSLRTVILPQGDAAAFGCPGTASYIWLTVEHPALLPGLGIDRKCATESRAEIQGIVMEDRGGQKGTRRHAGFQFRGITGVVLPGNVQFIDIGFGDLPQRRETGSPVSPPHTDQPPVLPWASAPGVAHRHMAMKKTFFIKLMILRLAIAGLTPPRHPSSSPGRCR
jgi:hypothetical protein